MSPSKDLKTLVKYLPRDEFDLSVCSLRGDSTTEIPSYLKDLGIPCVVTRFRPRHYSPRGVAQSWRDYRKLVEGLGHIDIQHSLDFATPPFEAMFARTSGARFVVTLTDILKKPILTFKRSVALRMKFLLTHRVIAISQSVFDYARRLRVSSSKLRTIYNGIDFEDFDKALLSDRPRDPNYLLSVGQIIPRKRHEDAIRALALARKEHPNLRLGIVGIAWSSEYKDSLLQLAKDLNVGLAVEFLGTRDDIPSLMQSASALLHCSGNEAFGWVVVEAMAAGLPVIAADVDGPREIIVSGQTGDLIPVGDIAGFASAIRRVLAGGVQIKEQVKRANQEVRQRFSAHTMAESTADVYRELISNNSAAAHANGPRPPIQPGTQEKGSA